MRKSVETIKIKGQDDLEYEISFTHRGPLIDFDLIATSEGALFGGSIPKINGDFKYSYGWAGATLQAEHSITATLEFTKAKSVKEFMETMDSVTKDGYNGIGMNLVLADSQGNIGY